MSALVSVTVSLNGEIVRFASLVDADAYLHRARTATRSATPAAGVVVRRSDTVRRTPAKTAKLILTVMTDGQARTRAQIGERINREPDAFKACMHNLIDQGLLAEQDRRTVARGQTLVITDAGREALRHA